MLPHHIHPVRGPRRWRGSPDVTSGLASNGVHCIGIGGIGVSALARLYRAGGFRVTGSDLVRSEITEALVKEGIRVFIGTHGRKHILPSVTRVVYSAAVRRNNPELREAQHRGIPCQTYAQALGELTRGFKTIAVAGSHGKSTTTAMIALVMTRAGLDPTVIVGTKLKEFGPPAGGSNFRLGRSPYLVIEADEYHGSFWNYRPWLAVVTSIDREHIDFYQNIAGVTQGFKKFIKGVAPDGHLILNADDARLKRISQSATQLPRNRVHWFSRRNREAPMLRRTLRIPGQHNVANALAAYRVGEILGIPRRRIVKALAAYRGSWRRFDYQGALHGAKVFADYAHHPTEVKATLEAAREKFPKRRIWCVFQPHHYERTHDLFKEFSRAFRDCDALILLDIYEVAGRERTQKSRTVNSETLAAAVSRHGTPALYVAHPARLRPFLRKSLRPGDVLLMMGAGSIWEMTKALMRSKIKDQN